MLLLLSAFMVETFFGPEFLLEINALYAQIAEYGQGEQSSHIEEQAKKLASIMLKDIKAGVLVCDGVPDARFTRFMNMPGRPQQQTEPQIPFEVSYDYFHITNTGLK